MDHRADRQLVVEHDAHLVADLDVDLGRRHGAVVRPRLHDLARLDLPVDDLGGDVELLVAVGGHREVEQLAAELALLLLDEAQRPRVHRRLHLLRRVVAVEVVGGRGTGRRSRPLVDPSGGMSPSVEIMSVPCMPASLWPGISQNIS